MYGASPDLETGNHEYLYQHGSYVSSVAWLTGETAAHGHDGELCWPDLAQCGTRRVHDFWSWDMAVSPADRFGLRQQYMAGGYKYEPQPERIIDSHPVRERR